MIAKTPEGVRPAVLGSFLTERTLGVYGRGLGTSVALERY